MKFQKIDHQGQFYYNTNNNSTSMKSLFYEFLGVKTVTTISLELCSLFPESELYNIL